MMFQKVAQIPVEEASSKFIKDIINKGLDPNARYGDNKTLLHISAEHNAIDVTRVISQQLYDNHYVYFFTKFYYVDVDFCWG